MSDTLALMFMDRAKSHPEYIAQYSKNGSGKFIPSTYGEVLEEIASFGAGLLELGIKRGDKIGLISDNRKEWLICDLAMQGLGVADVPRGCDATEQEIAYILAFSDCAFAILENDRQIAKILSRKQEMPILKSLILIDQASVEVSKEVRAMGLDIYQYSDIMQKGIERRKTKPGEYEAEAEKGKSSDLATIIYTSGTTGEPKGVMLSHANFLHQTEALPELLHIKPEQVWLSVLPVWHSFERLVQYNILSIHNTIAYSKPIGSIMLPDFQAIKPHWMASVPRIWESVKEGVYKNIRQAGGIKKQLFSFFVLIGKSHSHFKNMLFGLLPNFGNRSGLLDAIIAIIPLILLTPLRGLGEVLIFKKIKVKLGGRFIAGISGGGAMPASVDIFFNAIGVQLLEGYGLTETAPVIALRPQDKPVMGTVGPAIKATSFKILDEQGKDLGCCKKGIVYVKGPQVMMGYYKKPDLTAKILSQDGWLNTGDLGMLTKNNFLKLTGRAKDTIVLLGGENIEPLPIEQHICDSPFISQAIVLGQDQRYLAALIIPDQDMILSWAKDNNIPIVDYEILLKQPEVKELIDYEITQAISQKNGFRIFERIFKFELLAKPFEVGKELSAKQEVKRHAVAELYKQEISRLFKA